MPPSISVLLPVFVSAVVEEPVTAPLNVILPVPLTVKADCVEALTVPATVADVELLSVSVPPNSARAATDELSDWPSRSSIPELPPEIVVPLPSVDGAAEL